MIVWRKIQGSRMRSQYEKASRVHTKRIDGIPQVIRKPMDDRHPLTEGPFESLLGRSGSLLKKKPRREAR